MNQLLFLFCLFSLIIAECPPESQFDSIFGKCLQYVPQPASFSDAENYCVAHDGHLVSIQNAFQTTQLLSSIQSNPGFSYYNYWIGLQEKQLLQWTWTDGSQLSYSNWEVRQPDNVLPCTMALNGAGGTWMTTNCTKTLPYVCAFFEDSPNNV